MMVNTKFAGIVATLVLVQLLVPVVELTPTLEATICERVNECIANCTNVDPNIAGAYLLDCTAQAIEQLPADTKESFICSLLDKVNPPPVQKYLEEKLENALELKYQDSDWCCIAYAYEAGKLVSILQSILLCERNIDAMTVYAG